jgi:hypothetical protein
MGKPRNKRDFPRKHDRNGVFNVQGIRQRFELLKFLIFSMNTTLYWPGMSAGIREEASSA